MGTRGGRKRWAQEESAAREADGKAAAAGERAEEAPLSLLRALASREALLLFVILLLGAGVGLMWINNIDIIVTAKGGGSSDTAVLVSLTSTSNCVGRFYNV